MGRRRRPEAFISVWRFARTYRPERGAVVGWLYRSRETPDTPPPAAARPVAGRRTRPRRPVTHARGPDGGKLEAFQLHVCIERLPQNEREIIELAYLKGCPRARSRPSCDAPGDREDAKPRRVAASPRSSNGRSSHERARPAGLERRLHTLPPLLDVPPPGRPIRPGRRRDPGSPAATGPRRSRGWSRRWSLAGSSRRCRCGRRGNHHGHVSVRRPHQVSAHRDLTGTGNASGSVASERRRRRRAVVVDQPPRPRARRSVLRDLVQDRWPHAPGVAFNADSNGTAEVHLTARPTRSGCDAGSPPIHQRPGANHRHARQPTPLRLDLCASTSSTRASRPRTRRWRRQPFG